MNTNWKVLNSENADALKSKLFSIIQDASFKIHELEQDDPSLLELIPRINSIIKSRPNELKEFRGLLNSLARSTGLWNYIDVGSSEAQEAIVSQAFSSKELDEITFHREQIKALNFLFSGKNLVLSAPTSFGKSILIDALLASGRYQRVAIVLPTIALLDEFRRRLQSRFEKTFNIIMHKTDVATSHPTIFLGTQERFINRNDVGILDLTVVDEFYKLDPARQDERCIMLNAAVNRLVNDSKQFLFLGPNIKDISPPNSEKWRFEFLKTRFSTVAVDTLDLRKVKNKKIRLFDEAIKRENSPSLIFVSYPKKANQLAIELSERGALSTKSIDFSLWLKENIGSKHFLSDFIRKGIGVHHGKLPRSIAAKIVRLFNQNKIPVLFCTSTLIEGVNTAAKTVMIFDKKIANQNYDFFTFSNIRGRAGRLGQHDVGQVVLFNDIPAEFDLKVNPSMFSADDAYADEYIVHLDDFELSPRSLQRLQYYKEDLKLTSEELKIASFIGFENVIKIRNAVAVSAARGRALFWDALPSWKNLEELARILDSVTGIRKFGVASPRQLALLIEKFRKAKTFKEFLVTQDLSSPERVLEDYTFGFLRACEFGLPQFISVIEIFAKQFDPSVNYSFLTGSLPNWFKPTVLKELDEEGLPIQITERFFYENDSRETLKQRLVDLAKENDESLTKFECEWILDVI